MTVWGVVPRTARRASLPVVWVWRKATASRTRVILLSVVVVVVLIAVIVIVGQARVAAARGAWSDAESALGRSAVDVRHGATALLDEEKTAAAVVKAAQSVSDPVHGLLPDQQVDAYSSTVDKLALAVKDAPTPSKPKVQTKTPSGSITSYRKMQAQAVSWTAENTRAVSTDRSATSTLERAVSAVRSAAKTLVGGVAAATSSQVNANQGAAAATIQAVQQTAKTLESATGDAVLTGLGTWGADVKAMQASQQQASAAAAAAAAASAAAPAAVSSGSRQASTGHTATRGDGSAYRGGGSSWSGGGSSSGGGGSAAAPSGGGSSSGGGGGSASAPSSGGSGGGGSSSGGGSAPAPVQGGPVHFTGANYTPGCQAAYQFRSGYFTNDPSPTIINNGSMPWTGTTSVSGPTSYYTLYYCG